ncbi:hypothetical protein [Pseudoduganella namucuonensis]|uniref:Uncharacterized protein n=1 Tax=Pseudoduganella namucuonensis TaxID=1035707 RepID=A0A1I7LA49_9BURK|nr:hypothetical protein [Pseudoduganella namucuonensis]SFV06565.1 hypothetical protein SAMN05216552_102576 [Pseudoduganella namucuonensis]
MGKTWLAGVCLALAGGVAAGQEAPDSVRMEGGQVLVRFRTMTVLLDPSGDAASMPPVDLVLLRGCGERQRAWLARQTLDRSVVVAAGRPCAAELRGQGVRRAQVLGLWGAYALRRGAVSVRLTVMPGAGPRAAAWLGDAAPEDAAQDQSLGVMLDFSDGAHGALRLYAGGDADDVDLAAIPQRFPGADLAVVRRDGEPLLGAVETRRDGSRVMRMVALAPDAAYRIPAARAAGAKPR